MSKMVKVFVRAAGEVKHSFIIEDYEKVFDELGEYYKIYKDIYRSWPDFCFDVMFQ